MTFNTSDCEIFNTQCDWVELDTASDLEELEELTEGGGITDSRGFGMSPKNLAEAWEAHELICDHGEVARVLLEYHGRLDYAVAMIGSYVGTIKSIRDYALDFLEDWDIPQLVLVHCDLEGLGNDLLSDYTVLEGEDGLLLFGP